MSVLTSHIRHDILARASRAESKRQVCDILLESILASGLDRHSVALEDVKSLLVLAMRAQRRRMRAAA